MLQIKARGPYALKNPLTGENGVRKIKGTNQNRHLNRQLLSAFYKEAKEFTYNAGLNGSQFSAQINEPKVQYQNRHNCS